MSEDDRQARLVVIAFYQQQHPIDFTIRSVHFTSFMLNEVGRAISDRRIYVSYSLRLPYDAMYNPNENRLTVKSKEEVSGRMAAAIIHEGIHAACDLYNMRWMHIETAEAAAYIAEFIYAQTNNITLHFNNHNLQIIATEAGRIARILRERGTPTLQQYEAVRAAVLRVPETRRQAGSLRPDGTRQPIFNGVPREENNLYHLP